MSDHILELLSAYIDGELHGGQLRKVEAHLDECQSCLEEYYALQALSATLRNAPAPDFPSPERFAADMALRLPRKQVKPMRRPALEVGWWLAPVGLIATWIFVSTTILVSNVFTAANEFGLLDGATAGLLSGSSSTAYWSATLGQFGILAGETLQWAELTETFTRITVPQFIWQISIALLYLSWMAIWWARHTRQGHGQPLDGGSSPQSS
jgi:predicted anti-sigma-YlaC factor YlaD